jgi:signal transduction histidine kinase
MKTIFILEDSRTDTVHLKKMLESLGYDVVGTAASGDEAAFRVPRLKPDLLFIDIILKERRMDGIDSARRILEQCEVPIVFLTSFSDESLVDRALEVSPYAYLLKPVSLDQLRVTLEAVRSRVRLERDRRGLIEQLNQAQKMEAIGRLAGGVAHNFNNILSIMIGNAELCMRNTPENHANAVRLLKIKTAGMRAADLTGKLLALSREEKYTLAAVSAGEIVEDLRIMLAEAISPGIRITTRVPENAGLLNVDFNQISQALLNVCLNACDAMPGGGELTIEAETLVLNPDACAMHQGLQPGPHCCLRICDTGDGIPEHILPRIFDPFFTTKGRSHGTGLGLSVTHGIIQGHGGAIHVESNQPRGSIFSILLPQASEPVIATPAPTDTAAIPARRNKTVLLVDDEPDFLEMTSETLSMDGYRIISAASGSQAVSLFRTHCKDIDLVLLDILMPGMDGGQVFHAIKDIDAAARVVLCSGYSTEDKVRELMDAGVDAFIRKPFVHHDLDRVLASVLDS